MTEQKTVVLLREALGLWPGPSLKNSGLLREALGPSLKMSHTK